MTTSTSNRTYKAWTSNSRTRLMRYLQRGMTYEEIAEMMGRSVSSLTNQAWRIRAGLIEGYTPPKDVEAFIALHVPPAKRPTPPPAKRFGWLNLLNFWKAA